MLELKPSSLLFVCVSDLEYCFLHLDRKKDAVLELKPMMPDNIKLG